ncbi:hypothetical protein ACSHT0_06505 [Tepidicaulis sp. LMO-SS28]|uniref:hypothetical protein n=1 Tax=Tepidicaulis sp. LMO-SS28 TaxID=3447455 RepID=UPI003EE388F6
MKKLGYGIEVGATLGGSFRSTMGQARQAMGGVGKSAAAQERGLKRAGRTARNTARETDRLDRSSSRLGRSMRRTKEEMARAARGAANYGRTLGRAAMQSQKLGKMGTLAGKGLDFAANKYTALVGAVGLGATVRQVGNLQERFVRLGIQANKSQTEINALKKEIYDTALSDGVRVDAGEITAAVETIIEKTGDLDLARDNLQNIALAIQASGAAGQDIGAMVANMWDKYGIRESEEVLQQLDRFVEQGKFAAFALKDQATQSERLMAAYAGVGRTGAAAASEQGALIQMFRKGTGSAEQAVTAFERTLAELRSKSEDVEDLGVDVWDPEALAEGRREMRAITDVLKELIMATDGDVKKLGEIFGDESIRGINVLASEFNRTGGFQQMEDLLKTGGTGDALSKDADRASRTFNQVLGSLATAWARFAENKLTKPIDMLAGAISDLGAEGANTAFTLGSIGAGLVGGAVAARKLGIGRLFSRGRKGAAAAGGGAAGAGLGAFGGVTPVHVTNMPPGGFGGMGAGGGRGRAGRGAARAGRLGRALRGGGKLLGRAALPLALGLGAVDLVGAARSGNAEEVGRSGGGLAGALGGAAAGAAIGSIVPIIGTTIGGILGGILGGFGGEWLGGTIGKAVGGAPETNAASATPVAASAAAASSAPAAQAALRPVQVTNQITVHAAPGMDEDTLVRKIMQRMEASTRRALHD